METNPNIVEIESNQHGAPTLQQLRSLYLALYYRLTLGWSVIPLKAQGKTPLVTWKPYQDKHASTDEINEWFHKWPDANIGLVTGAISGVIVVDLDLPEAVKEFESRNGGPADTLIVQTARGLHLYYRYPRHVTPSRTRLLPGMDIRGDGGYAVALGSRHESGAVYDIATLSDIAPLPSWLQTLIATPPVANGSVQPEEYGNGKRIAEGQRNDELFRIARSNHARGMADPIVKAAIHKMNREQCDPPLPGSEVDKLLKHALEQSNRTLVTPKAQPLETIPAHELVGRPQPPRVWLWNQILASGTSSIISAYAKTGKSTLIYQLAVAVAEGKSPFLGRSVSQSRVLILAAEEGEFDVSERLKRYGVHKDKRIPLDICSETDITIERVRATITANKLGLVILDTLGAWWTVKDENNNSEVSRAVKPWTDLAHETGCAILLIHHTGKSGGNDIRAHRGASSLSGAVDQTGMSRSLLNLRTE